MPTMPLSIMTFEDVGLCQSLSVAAVCELHIDVQVTLRRPELLSSLYAAAPATVYLRSRWYFAALTIFLQ